LPFRFLSFQFPPFASSLSPLGRGAVYDTKKSRAAALRPGASCATDSCSSNSRSAKTPSPPGGEGAIDFTHSSLLTRPARNRFLIFQFRPAPTHTPLGGALPKNPKSETRNKSKNQSTNHPKTSPFVLSEFGGSVIRYCFGFRISSFWQSPSWGEGRGEGIRSSLAETTRTRAAASVARSSLARSRAGYPRLGPFELAARSLRAAVTRRESCFRRAELAARYTYGTPRDINGRLRNRWHALRRDAKACATHHAHVLGVRPAGAYAARIRHDRLVLLIHHRYSGEFLRGTNRAKIWMF
jgi:hypothetical protein